MSYTVQAHKASDSEKPLSCCNVDDTELLEQDRRQRSSKPEEHYHLVLAKNVKGSLDDRLPIDYNDDKFHHLTVPNIRQPRN